MPHCTLVVFWWFLIVQVSKYWLIFNVLVSAPTAPHGRGCMLAAGHARMDLVVAGRAVELRGSTWCPAGRDDHHGSTVPLAGWRGTWMAREGTEEGHGGRLLEVLPPLTTSLTRCRRRPPLLPAAASPTCTCPWAPSSPPSPPLVNCRMRMS
jgi:hypothetical protein